MNYWLHRISHHAELSYPLLDKGYLTIGFSDFTHQEFIDKVLQDDKNYFDGQFQKKWGKVSRTRHNLWRFLKFNKGDIIIVPSWGSFYVCEITDDKPLLIAETFSDDLKTWNNNQVNSKDNRLLNENGAVIDLGFARKIKVIHEKVSREKYADSKLTSRMKIRYTNASINDLEESIKKSIVNYKAKKPIHLHSIILDKTANSVLKCIKGELNSDKFEKLLQIYFTSTGANEVTIPAKNEKDKEGDADIIATFESIKLIIYIQAKFQTGQISEFGVNQILEYKTDKENLEDDYNRIAWVITTADSFNEEAERKAREHEIQLINGLEFSKMLLNVGINLLNTNL